MESYSLLISDNKTDIRTNFNAPLILNRDKQYELALVSIETYYSFPNIDVTNNKFVYNNGSEWKEILIAEGSYQLADINDYIKSELVRLGEPEGVIELSPNTNTLKCVLKISDPKYQVSFEQPKSLRYLLGFESGIYSASSQEGEKNIDIMKLNSILVHCDIVSGSFVNGQHYPTIYSFFPNVSPGYKIVETPHNLIYLPVTTDCIRSIRVWLTSENGKEMLNLRGENVTLRFHLKSK
jgi:hypothetical protein